MCWCFIHYIFLNNRHERVLCFFQETQSRCSSQSLPLLTALIRKLDKWTYPRKGDVNVTLRMLHFQLMHCLIFTSIHSNFFPVNEIQESTKYIVLILLSSGLLQFAVHILLSTNKNFLILGLQLLHLTLLTFVMFPPLLCLFSSHFTLYKILGGFLHVVIQV